MTSTPTLSPLNVSRRRFLERLTAATLGLGAAIPQALPQSAAKPPFTDIELVLGPKPQLRSIAQSLVGAVFGGIAATSLGRLMHDTRLQIKLERAIWANHNDAALVSKRERSHLIGLIDDLAKQANNADSKLSSHHRKILQMIFMTAVKTGRYHLFTRIFAEPSLRANVDFKEAQEILLGSLMLTHSINYMDRCFDNASYGDQEPEQDYFQFALEKILADYGFAKEGASVYRDPKSGLIQTVKATYKGFPIVIDAYGLNAIALTLNPMRTPAKT